LDLQARDLGDDEQHLPAVLTESLATEAANASGCTVVTSADVREMLDFEATKVVACVEGASSCLAEIGSALGAERVIGGTVTHLGTQWIISARLMNVSQGTVEVRTEQVAHSPEQQRAAAQNAARALFHQPVTPLAPSSSSSSSSPSSSSPPITSTGPGTMLWVGVGAAAVGGLALVGGGVVTGLAEGQLADANATDKSSSIATGQVGLAVAAVGAVVAVVGGIVIVTEGL
jgi:TolB-like protein